MQDLHDILSILKILSIRSNARSFLRPILLSTKSVSIIHRSSFASKIVMKNGVLPKFASPCAGESKRAARR